MTLQWQDYIEKSPGVMSGKPVFKWAWLAVEHVRNALGTGMRENGIVKGYSPLRHDPLRRNVVRGGGADGRVKLVTNESKASSQLSSRLNRFFQKTMFA